MKITVAIPNYRNPKSLDALLGQLIGLGFYKIYVLDDYSPSEDNIEGIVRNYKNVTFIGSKERLLITKNRNRALSLDIGDVLLFVDSDMKLISGDLCECLKKDFKDTLVGIVGGEIIQKESGMAFNFGRAGFFPINVSPYFSWINPISKAISLVTAKISKNTAPKFEATWVAEGVMAVRSSVFKRLNGFDENFKLFHEGPDLCRRLRQLGYTVMVDTEIQFEHLGIVNIPKKEQIRRSTAYWFIKHYGWPKSLAEYIFRNSV